MNKNDKQNLEDIALSAQLGDALRNRRKAIGKTILQIAEETALSVSFISQIERGRSTPSFVSFFKIANALESSMDELIKVPKQNNTVTRSEKREKFNLGDASRAYENLAPGFEGALLNACIVYRPAGAVSEKFNHEGEEMIYQIKGTVYHTLDDEKYTIEAGDTIHFDSKRTHSSVIGDEDSIELWVGTMPILDS